MILVAAVVVIVVIAAGVLLMNSPSTPSGAQTSTIGNGTSQNAPSQGSSNTSGSGSTFNSSIGLQNLLAANCGAGNSCLSKSELEAMVGPVTGYNATSTTNPGAIAVLVGAKGVNSSILSGNVTEIWVVGANTTSTSPPMAVLELVYQSPVAQKIYASLLTNSGIAMYNVTNSTLNGLTYSYSGAQSQYGSGATLFGYKGNEIVYFWSIGKYVDAQTLATAIASDMP